MKQVMLFFSLLCLHTATGFAQSSKNVLFLGNSYTAVNNLPQMIADIATSMGDTLIYDSNTPGGYTLQGHASNPQSLSQIMAGNRDYVVLQEQSQYPAFPLQQVQEDVFPYAGQLDSLIHEYNTCAQTVFYMTWGRKNGDADNCASWPPVCTYQGMDSLLHLRYMMMAEDNNALVSPVGAVWKYLRTNHPELELYQADESHPSVAGSYAAACCFYTVFFRKDPVNISFNSTLSAADAGIIRGAVKALVFDSMMNWHIGQYDPVASFTVNQSGNAITTVNTSVNAISYWWNFGDGTTDTAANPGHTYTADGTYTIQLVTTFCTLSDTAVAEVIINNTGIATLAFDDIFQLYPNPLQEQAILDIKINGRPELRLTTATGIELNPDCRITDKRIYINTANLPAGVYYLSLTMDGKIWRKKVVKL